MLYPWLWTKVGLESWNLIDGRIHPKFQSKDDQFKTQVKNRRTSQNPGRRSRIEQSENYRNRTQTNYYRFKGGVKESSFPAAQQMASQEDMSNYATQTDYYKPVLDKRKVIKSSSYSPHKKKGRRGNRRILDAPGQNLDYREDSFFFENSNIVMTDMTQNDESFSYQNALAHTKPIEGGKKRFISKDMINPVFKRKRKGKVVYKKVESGNKSFNLGKSTHGVSNGRSATKNGNYNTNNSRNLKGNTSVANGAPQFSFKSKIKKRLKFTLRNTQVPKQSEKAFDDSPSKNSQLFEMNDIVSIIGINKSMRKQSKL